MTDEANKPQDQTEQAGGQVGGVSGSSEAPPRAARRDQAFLVWAGIACLIVAAVMGYQVAKRKDAFKTIVRHLSDPRNRDGNLMNDWAGRLRSNGGPTCKAIADMITSEQVPDLLKQKGISNLDDLLIAAGEGGELGPVCQSELTRQLNLLAWALALGGIALIGLDILRERGKVGGRKSSPPVG